MGLTFYNRHGDVVTIEDLPSDDAAVEDYIRVALDDVGEASVSTILLMLPISYTGNRPIFETVVFVKGEPELTRRWHSEAAALAGHAEIVEILQDEQRL